MRYDFETVIRRENAGSGKWDEIKRTLGCFPKDVIPFSVADMEFDMVPEVREGLKAFLDRSVMGYAAMTEEYRQTVVSWEARVMAGRSSRSGSGIRRVSSMPFSRRLRRLQTRRGCDAHDAGVLSHVCRRHPS